MFSWKEKQRFKHALADATQEWMNKQMAFWTGPRPLCDTRNATIYNFSFMFFCLKENPFFVCPFLVLFQAFIVQWSAFIHRFYSRASLTSSSMRLVFVVFFGCWSIELSMCPIDSSNLWKTERSSLYWSRPIPIVPFRCVFSTISFAVPSLAIQAN